MTIKEIYEKFDRIGCLTFATVNEKGEPETRIAHLRAHDEGGIYFMTMHTKGFYRELKSSGKVSLCGLSARSEVEHDKDGSPIFDGGYFIKLTGEVSEVSMEDIKAKQNPIFDFCIKDQEKYNAMVVFCITAARGEIFDYDFEKISRENKLQRDYFSYNGAEKIYKGLKIDSDRCISCGVCKDKCSFLAINDEGGVYSIDKHLCDECGDCLINCPVEAISSVITT